MGELLFRVVPVGYTVPKEDGTFVSRWKVIGPGCDGSGSMDRFYSKEYADDNARLRNLAMAKEVLRG